VTALDEWPRPLVQGHRGAGESRAGAALVENTVASFAAALAAGADAVEMDVRVSPDGAMVVLHDESPLRTFGSDGFADVPLLDEVLDGVRGLVTWDGSPARVNVELKAKGVPAARLVVGALAAAGLVDGRAMVSSFDLATLVAVKELAPDLPCGALVPGTLGRQVIEAAAERELEAVHPHGDDALLARHIADAHDHALLVYAWTVNDPIDQERLLDDDVDGLITDAPAALHALLART
jgi:glycerophosphoryl diester phosphodiesterase